jgi:hypothetical protein
MEKIVKLEKRWILQSMVIPVFIALALGCASAKITPTETASSERIPKPDVVLVYDFAVGPDDVVLDTLGHEFQSEAKERTKEEKQAYATAASLSEQLVAKLQKRGIPAERAEDRRVPPLHALVLKGQFLTINKGSRVKRMVIGFGAGSSKLQVRAQAYQATRYGLRRIAAAEVSSHGSKMPGMAVPVAGGAVAGTVATSAVISGGMNIAKETRGAMKDDAGRIADEIANRAQAFYERQGWL